MWRLAVSDVAEVEDRAELSFLAPPDQLSDWRMVVAFDAAANLGVDDAHPRESLLLARP